MVTSLSRVIALVRSVARRNVGVLVFGHPWRWKVRALVARGDLHGGRLSLETPSTGAGTDTGTIHADAQEGQAKSE